MKKPLLFAVVLAWTASVAEAGGIHLAWNDCLGAGGATNRNFACDTNVGDNDLFVSFDPPEDIPDISGSNPLIDMQSAGSSLPQWWQLRNIGSCRQTSISALNVPTGTCPDTWAGAGVANVAAWITTLVVTSTPLNRARLLGSISVPTSMAQAVHPGTEYLCMQIRIDNAKTIATACTGCDVPYCLVLADVDLYTNSSAWYRLTSDFQDNFCLWQGGDIGGVGCPAATPTVNRAWGQLKAIYR